MKKQGAVEEINVKEIKDPTFLKDLDYGELEVLCYKIRQEILSAVSEKGGHLSSNLGIVELTVALHRVFDFKTDKLILDVGHQCYTHKILTGRSLDGLNKPGGISGFQKREESEYDPYEAGHSSNSISAAEAFAVARDIKGEKYDVVALIGDASIANGLAFEGMNDVGARDNKIIVVLNDNEMAITPSVGATGLFFRRVSAGRAYNDFKKGFRRVFYRGKVGRAFYRFSWRAKNRLKRLLVPMNIFDHLGFVYLGPINGHDIKRLERAFKKAKESTKSVVIHVRTIKGRGYPYAEQDNTGYWHGVTPFDINTGAPKNFHPGLISWSHFFADLTGEMMKKHDDAYLITPATLKGSGLEKVFADYPNRTRDVGIAEEHATTFAGAMALNGFHPIVSIYSTFLQRAYDEVSHDCARLKANVTFLIDRAGLVGKDGETHQGIYDVAYLSSIPGVTVTMPSNKAEARYLYEESFQKGGVYAIRLPREFVLEAREEGETYLRYGQFNFVGHSRAKDLAVVSVGPKAREIQDLFAKNHVDAEVVNPIYLCPFDDQSVLPLLAFKTILIHDAYGTKEGFASRLESRLLELGFHGKVILRTVPTAFIPGGTKENQEKSFGLLSSQILDLAREILGK